MAELIAHLIDDRCAWALCAYLRQIWGHFQFAAKSLTPLKPKMVLLMTPCPAYEMPIVSTVALVPLAATRVFANQVSGILVAQLL